jgi:hypothetical protein
MMFKAVNRGCRIASTGLKIKRNPEPKPCLPCVTGAAQPAGTLSKILTMLRESGQQHDFSFRRRTSLEGQTCGGLGNPRDQYRKIFG